MRGLALWVREFEGLQDLLFMGRSGDEAGVASEADGQ